ncbi:MAG: sugar ABC transporter permease [Lachnospiraceae bacterium]|nr:sugar ABC transporter permease [Lachnospiraceae bacterium]
MDAALKKVMSCVMMILGVLSVVVSLVMATAGSGESVRGMMLVLGIIIFFVGLYFFPTQKHHRKIVYVIFLFPLLFTFAVTVIIPLVLGICYSFTDWTGIRFSQVVGLDNYTTMFSDPAFIWSILITFIFVVMNMVLINLVGFLLALLCTSGLKGGAFFRASYFLPNLIGGIVLGYIWQFVFNNVLIKMTGNISWLAQSKTALFAIVIVYIWQYAGYIMLIYITGLTQIPGDVLEAAKIDGANPSQTLFKIKIPMIASTITICTFLTLTSAFKQFDVNMALTNGAGSVANFMGNYLSNGTQMLALNIYNTAISKNNYALGQAKAVFFFIILAIVSLIQVRISNKKEVEL